MFVVWITAYDDNGNKLIDSIEIDLKSNSQAIELMQAIRKFVVRRLEITKVLKDVFVATKCEHASAEYSSLKVAKTVAIRITNKTDILHVVKKYGPMWIVTCELFGKDK